VAAKSATEGQDFFPLTVEYRERAYAGGRIPGGYFKREGRPVEKEILTSRLIDRPIRPLFPKGFKNEVQVICLAVSADQENDPDVLALNGASAALCLAGIPFGGPVGAVRVGMVEGKLIANPTTAEQVLSSLELVIAGHGRIAETLARLGHLMNFAVTVHDPSAVQESFPDAQRIIVKDFGVTEIAFGPNAYVVIATLHKNDHLWLQRALEGEAAYVALIASAHRSRLVLDYLLAEGISAEKVERIFRLGKSTYPIVLATAPLAGYFLASKTGPVTKILKSAIWGWQVVQRLKPLWDKWRQPKADEPDPPEPEILD